MNLKPISLKVPVDVLARIDAAAAERKTTRTALLLDPWLEDDGPTFEQAVAAVIATRLAPDYTAPSADLLGRYVKSYERLRTSLSALTIGYDALTGEPARFDPGRAHRAAYRSRQRPLRPSHRRGAAG